MRRQLRTLCTALWLSLALGAVPALAQSGKLTSRVLRDPSGQKVIVIHDTRPEAYSRQRDAAVRAQQAREADAQRKHEIELARIEADARVRVARAQNPVVQQAAPAPVYNAPKPRPSFFNGGQFTGFSDIYVGGFGYGFGGFGVPFYGGGYGYGRNCAPRYAGRACGPVYRGRGSGPVYRGGGGGWRCR